MCQFASLRPLHRSSTFGKRKRRSSVYLRRGFTLVELLVVIAIIGLLVALILPGVQAAREAARRTSCQNNLRQVALALHNYHSVHKRYPYAGSQYGWCLDANEVPGCGSDAEYNRLVKNANGWALVLPFLEQNAVYQQLDFRQAFAARTVSGLVFPRSSILLGDPVASGNAEALSTIIPTFLCPSDPNETTLLPGFVAPGNTQPPAMTNYDFSTRANHCCQEWLRRPRRRPMFGEDSDTRNAAVLDGLSNTLMVAETRRGVVNGTGSPWGFRSWVMPGVDFARAINDERAPGAQQPVPGRLGSWGRTGSLHPGGMHIALADGSIHFVNDSIDDNLRVRLRDMNDHSPIEFP